jgi:hypothetical protein
MITHFHDDASNPAWLDECRAMETEGEITPIQVRADFERRGFCLFAGGEAVGATSSYKKTWLSRELALRERA